MELNFTNEGGVGNTIRFLKIIPGLWLLQKAAGSGSRKGGHINGKNCFLWESRPRHFSVWLTRRPPNSTAQEICQLIFRLLPTHRQPESTSVGEVVRCCLESLVLKTRKTQDDLELATGRHLAQPASWAAVTRIACSASSLLTLVTNRLLLAQLRRLPWEISCSGPSPLGAGRPAPGAPGIGGFCRAPTLRAAPSPAWDAAYQRFLCLVS